VPESSSSILPWFFQSSSADAAFSQILARRRRRAFAMTETELKLIAAAAIIGFSKSPNAGYSTPAAIGTPAAL